MESPNVWVYEAFSGFIFAFQRIIPLYFIQKAWFIPLYFVQKVWFIPFMCEQKNYLLNTYAATVALIIFALQRYYLFLAF